MHELSYREARPVAVPNPAAGAGFTYSLPGSERTRVLAVCFQLVTAVAVAARRVSCDLIDGEGGILGRFSSGFTQAASLTTVYTFAVGVNAYGANDAAAIGAPLADLMLPGAGSAVVSIANVQAADQVSAVRVTVAQVPYRDG